ncbi:uncharacterized protein LOC131223051 [Magnolia sinica]|uniref:uncharacterized protein LOC131223051 n=1 Tax=Magnolia sinica TaxID=86752 RepID=UPI00265A74E9|nr:uncharacterized protein LOC131223051 [Magnolia sinica]
MVSGEREQQTRHVTIGNNLGSLIVRPSESEGGGGGSDYEPGEVRREKNNHSNINHNHNNRNGNLNNNHNNRNNNHNDRQPLYSRSPRHSRSLRFPDKFQDKFQGYGNGMCAGSISPLNQRMCAGSVSPLRQRARAGSVSPLRQRKADHRYGSDFNHPGGPRHGPGYTGGRGRGRFREFSRPCGRGRGDRSFGRDFESFEVPGLHPSPFKDEFMGRNNPNVSPREGDWICSEPSCGNLNFARRAYCNNCNKLRFEPRSGGPGGSPRRSYLRPPSPHGLSPRFPAPPMERGRGRGVNGYGSPHGWGRGGARESPRGWGRDSPREFRMGPPSLRHVERFPDHHLPRERPDYHDEDGYKGRGKFEMPMPPQWGHRGRGRGKFFHERRGYAANDQQTPSPPLPLSPPQRGPWGHDRRERSRSPMRCGLRDYHRDSYMGRGRDYRRGMGRGRRIHGGY